MRKFFKAATGTALALVWGVAAVQFFMPGGIASVSSSVTTMLGGAAQIQLADDPIPLAAPSADGYAQNGWLQVREGRLTNAAGEPFQLRGMSSHGLAWFPEYTGISAIATTKSYGANLFRIAMYVDDAPGNYTTDARDQQANTSAMTAAVDNALSLDMYAIVDWHVLEDGNPLNRVDSAVAFFDAMSAKYADAPGVLYEICNEPNGGTSWEDIYAYAERVIPVIRANAPDALILVGTPEYSSDLLSAMAKPLPYDNVMYAYHYYSSMAPEAYEGVLEAARDAQFPVFVTEWGVGGGNVPVTAEEVQRASDFLLYLQDHTLSWANWSLCNKDESFSALQPSVSSLGSWTEDDLTDSGKLVFDALKMSNAQ